MRLGWAVAHPEVIRRVLLLKDEGGTSAFAQAVSLEYGRDGVLAAHIRDLVAAYRVKRDAMLGALDRYFPKEATWTRPAGGFFVWMRLPPTVDPALLAARAREQGVEYLPGEYCFAQPPEVPGTYLRLGYSLISVPDIEEAVKRLANVVSELLALETN
jgi:DNA-binding transcriptional MocR family regulator